MGTPNKERGGGESQQLVHQRENHKVFYQQNMTQTRAAQHTVVREWNESELQNA